MIIRIGWIARLVYPSTPAELALGPDGVQCEHLGNFPYPDIASVELVQGWFWAGIRLRFNDRRPAIEVKGLPLNAATGAQIQILSVVILPELQQLQESLDRLLSVSGYARQCLVFDWRKHHDAAIKRIPPDYNSPHYPDSFRNAVAGFMHRLNSVESSRREHNRRYTEAEIQKNQHWLHAIERYPLTRRQCEAVVCDEENTLVVAGAGTGKTSTLVAKVAYLVRAQGVKPEQILLLAFARKAAEEMQTRVKQRLGIDVTVRTFHGLGLEIIGAAMGRKPTLSKMADDPELFLASIKGYLLEAFASPECERSVRTFMTRYRYPDRSEFDAHTLGDHYACLRDTGIRSLNGEKVKSTGELAIADFLAVHGIEYVYEGRYEHDTATSKRRQYQPDFCLPQYRLYIEYFGVDEAGNPPPYVNAAEYREGMSWKRELHRTKGTTLFELFYHQHREGRLEEVLESHLRARGIPLAYIDQASLKDKLTANGEFDRVGVMVASFLTLYKSNRWTLDQVRSRANGNPQPRRAAAFLDLFEGILGRYSEALKADDEIDFSDMINAAADFVMAGSYKSPFTAILVDEFQDMSRGRAQLLAALASRHSDRRLFCVGDDWQSIYRFTGSDIGIMTNFAANFGFSERVDLEKTFRYPSEILEASSIFIQENPEQLRKALRASRKKGAAAIQVIWEAPDADEGDGLRRALASIHSQSPSASVMVLGRYRFSVPAWLAQLRRDYPLLRIEGHTVHSSKGLEADYVVIQGVTAGRHGFPTEVTDDPLLALVTAAPSAFENAEERRLFYVALTRARETVYLIADESRPSRFIAELSGEKYAGLVTGAVPGDRLMCPKCKTGYLIKRHGEYGIFWGCSNYPYCTGRANTCPKCHSGVLAKRGDVYRCTNTGCNEMARACPRCDDGILRRRNGRYGPFLGCSNWAPEGPSCTYTRNL